MSISENSLAALQSLESNQVFRTCLQFPGWIRLDDSTITEKTNPSDVLLYDPIFLSLLFTHMLTENSPTSALAWVEVFRTNVVCVIIRALSSKDDQIRELALSQVATLWKQLEVSPNSTINASCRLKSLEHVDMQEKPHVIHILNLLKSTVTSASRNEPPARIPAYTTLILCHALRGVFYPSNFIYPLTARFLLQRPELDIHDVPMLFGMLYSTSDEDWRKERAWIIRFLADGMMSTDDWKVLKRRHTWDLLASMFQSEADQALRSGILEVNHPLSDIAVSLT